MHRRVPIKGVIRSTDPSAQAIPPIGRSIVRRIKSLGIQGKVLAAFAVPLALLVVVAVVGVASMKSLFGHTQESQRAAVLDEQIMSLEIATLDAVSLEKEAIVEN